MNHWTGASYVESGDKPRALTVEAKDKNGNTVRGTWNPYADGSSMSIENNAVVVKNGTADFGICRRHHLCGKSNQNCGSETQHVMAVNS